MATIAIGHRITTRAAARAALCFAALASPAMPRAAEPAPAAPVVAAPPPVAVPPVHAHGNYLGAFFNVFWDDSTRLLNSGEKLGGSELMTSVDVTAGHMLTDCWGVQVHLSFTRDATSNLTQDNAHNNISLDGTSYGIALSPSVRRYHRVSEDTYVFVNLRPVFQVDLVDSQVYDTSRNVITPLSYTAYTFGLTMSPGLSAFITPHLSAEASLGVLGFSVTHGANDKGFRYDHTSVQFLFYRSSVNIGFNYYF